MQRVSALGLLQAHPAEPYVSALCLPKAPLMLSCQLLRVLNAQHFIAHARAETFDPASLLVFRGKLVIVLCSSSWWLNAQAFAGGLADGFAREGNGAAEAADAQAAAAAAVEHAARQAQVDRDDPIYQARARTCIGPHFWEGGCLLMSALFLLLDSSVQPQSTKSASAVTA